MTPGPYDLDLHRGATFAGLVLACQDAASEPVDLTGWTAQAEVRKTNGSATVVLDLAPVISNGPEGEVTLPEIRETETLDLPPGNYVWDLLLTDTAGKRTGPYVTGIFTIHRTVTRP